MRLTPSSSKRFWSRVHPGKESSPRKYPQETASGIPLNSKLAGLSSLAGVGLMAFLPANTIQYAQSQSPVPGLQGEFPLEILSREDSSDLTVDLTTGETVATNGVSVVYGPVRMDAEQMRLDQQSGWIRAEGNVLLQSATNIWVGDSLSYNLSDQQIEAMDFRTGQSPAFVYGRYLGGSTSAEPGESLIARDAYFTTDDTAEPGYRVSAGRVKVVPGEYVSARNATLFYHDVPLFWLPYYRQSLKKDGNRFVFRPGYRSRFGAYLNSSYLWSFNESLQGQMDLDLRTRRGIAAGPKVEYDSEDFGQGSIEYKHFWDRNPDLFSDGRNIDSNRYRLDFSHWWMPRTNLQIRARASKLSDPFVHADFFENDFRTDPQPKTFVEIRQFWDNFSAGLTFQPRLNTFFEQTERIPELTLSSYRQELGETGLFYESRSSLGYYQKRFADLSSSDYSAYRADTYHQILQPNTYFGWLNVTPQAGVRATEYGESDGPGATTSSETRFVADMGVDLSAKASRTWRGYRNSFWDLRGLRHLLQPSIHYIYVPDPSADPGQLPQFDPVIPSLRLLPSHFPDYESVDAIEGRHNVRFGLFNKLQTYRGDELQNFVHWGLFMDWRLDDRPGVTELSDIYSDLDWRMQRWLSLTSEFRWDTSENRARLADHRLVIDPYDDWSFAVGHRYIRHNDLFGEGNNLFSTSLYYWLDDNWSFNATHFFEGRSSTLQEQIYSVYRDHSSFSTALRFRVREPQFQKKDFTISLEFSLKGFPGAEPGTHTNQPEYLLDY